MARLAVFKDDEVLVLDATGQGKSLVALRTQDFLMKARQGVGGFVVRKPAGVLPRFVVMASQAVRAQVPAMLVHVARTAKS